LQDQWRKERKKAALLIKKIQNDPVERTVRLINKKAKPYAYLSQIRWRSNKALSPFVLNIQTLEVPKTGYEEMIVNRFEAPVKKLIDSFNREVLAPFNIPLREGHQAFIVFVLRSIGDYENYCRSGNPKGYRSSSAFYDSSLRAGITYIDRMNKKKDKEFGETRLILFQLAYSMLHGHKKNRKGPTDGLWAYVGLAESYSRCITEDLNTLIMPLSDAGRTSMSSLLKDKVQRKVFFLPLKTLVNIKDQNMLLNRIVNLKSKLDKEKYSWYWRALITFEKECAMFTHFLKYSDSQKYLKRYNCYVKSLLLEEGQKEAYDDLFPRGSMKVMQKEFIKYIQREFAFRDPSFILSTKDYADLIKFSVDPMKPVTLRDITKDTPSNKGEANLMLPSIDPGDLIVQSMEMDTALSVALLETADGAIDKAEELVDAILSNSDAKQTLKDLAARELRRITALGKLRSDFLLSLKTCGKRVSINHSGQRIKAIVKSFDEKKVVFKLPKNKTIVVPLKELTPAWLEKGIRDRRYKEAPDWLKAYAGLLSDTKSWERWLKRGGLDADELQKDVPVIQERLKSGRLVYLLNNMGSSALPADEIEADLCLQKIFILYEDFKDAKIMKEKEKALRGLASHAYAKIFDSLDLKETLDLQGEITSKDNNEVRLIYDFSDAAQLNDFESIEYLADFREKLHDVETSKEDTYYKIEDKGLGFSGQGCLRLKLALQAPLKVSYAYILTARGYEEADTLPFIDFRIGACDDGFGNCILTKCDGSISASHKPSSFYEEDALDKAGFLRIDVTYHNKLVVDGKDATTFMDGEKLYSVKCGPLEKGNLFVWIHSDAHLILNKLIFEGKVDEAFLSAKRIDWVIEKMKSIPKL